MYDTVKRLYLEGKIDETGLTRAVTFKWISEEQKQEIIDSKPKSDIEQK